jgi:hypothetical protein
MGFLLLKNPRILLEMGRHFFSAVLCRIQFYFQFWNLKILTENFSAQTYSQNRLQGHDELGRGKAGVLSLLLPSKFFIRIIPTVPTRASL